MVSPQYGYKRELNWDVLVMGGLQHTEHNALLQIHAVLK